jgi:hypothetical protein
MTFSGGLEPYGCTGDFTLTDFDTGKFFKALDPERPPTIDGRFEVAGKFAGNGVTARHALENARGRFDLTSRQGVFRGFQRVSNKLSMASKAVDSLSSVLGSILGSEKGTKAAEKVAGSAYFVDQLAQELAEINYDQLTVKVSGDGGHQPGVSRGAVDRERCGDLPGGIAAAGTTPGS